MPPALLSQRLERIVNKARPLSIVVTADKDRDTLVYITVTGITLKALEKLQAEIDFELRTSTWTVRVQLDHDTMPDITMCSGIDCPMKDKCYRFTAIPRDRQSWMAPPFYYPRNAAGIQTPNPKCREFIDNKGKRNAESHGQIP